MIGILQLEPNAAMGSGLASSGFLTRLNLTLSEVNSSWPISVDVSRRIESVRMDAPQ